MATLERGKTVAFAFGEYTRKFLRGGSAIGGGSTLFCGDAVWRLAMGCRWMLGIEDRTAIMALTGLQVCRSFD